MIMKANYNKRDAYFSNIQEHYLTKYAMYVWLFKSKTTGKIRVIINDTVNDRHGEVTREEAIKDFINACSKDTLVETFYDSKLAFECFKKNQAFHTVLI